MKNALMVKLGGTILFVTALAGCQTVPASNMPARFDSELATETDPPSHAVNSDNAWRPQGCIMFPRSEINTVAERQFRLALGKACQQHGIPLIEDGGPVPAGTTAFLQVLRIQQEMAASGPVQESGPYRWYACHVECSDRRNDWRPQPNTAKSLVTISRLLTFDSDIIPSRSNDSNDTLWMLANEIAAVAANGMYIRQIFLDVICQMDASDVTRRGSELFMLQRYEQASLYLGEICRRYPDYQPAFSYLGACALGAYDLARATLTQTIRLAPDTEEAHRAKQWLEMLSASP